MTSGSSTRHRTEAARAEQEQARQHEQRRRTWTRLVIGASVLVVVAGVGLTLALYCLTVVVPYAASTPGSSVDPWDGAVGAWRCSRCRSRPSWPSSPAPGRRGRD